MTGPQRPELTAAGLAPSNAPEAGVAAMVPPGLYNALLAGLNNGTDIGLLEVYGPRSAVGRSWPIHLKLPSKKVRKSSTFLGDAYKA
jgi:hypothetical protein